MQNFAMVVKNRVPRDPVLKISIQVKTCQRLRLWSPNGQSCEQAKRILSVEDREPAMPSRNMRNFELIEQDQDWSSQGVKATNQILKCQVVKRWGLIQQSSSRSAASQGVGSPGQEQLIPNGRSFVEMKQAPDARS